MASNPDRVDGNPPLMPRAIVRSSISGAPPDADKSGKYACRCGSEPSCLVHASIMCQAVYSQLVVEGVMIGDESNEVYFRRRAAAETETALAGKNALIREIHQELATLYEARADAATIAVVDSGVSL